MSPFLAQKTNPSKSKFAKLFAIFLMCFLVGGVTNIIFAETSGSGLESDGVALSTRSTAAVMHLKDGSTSGKNALYKIVTVANKTELSPAMKAAFADHPIATTVTGVATLPLGISAAAFSALNDAILNKGVYVYRKQADGTWGDPLDKDSFSIKKLGMAKLDLDPEALNSQIHNPNDTYLTYNEADGVYEYHTPGNEPYKVPSDSILAFAEEQKKIEASKGTQNDPGSLTSNVAKTNVTSQANAKQIAENAANGSKSNPLKADLSCTLTKGDIACVVVKAINFLLITITGWALSASGWLLDSVFQYTVVNLSGTLGLDRQGRVDPSGFYSIIKIIWGMFRDIINMSFIFLLLYASIMTIFKADTGRVKSMVKNVVIVAILINFSLFFATTIIDISNQLAVGMYNQITQGQGTDGSGKGNNLAAAFLTKLHLEKLLTESTVVDSYSKILIISVMGAVFILILSVLFFVISILFIVRFVTLIMLMMMSPVGIAGIAVPKIGSLFGGSYWKDLLSQCFFAPIMIFFIWISVKMLDAIVKMGGMDGNVAAKFTDGTTAKAGLGGFILGFIVLVFMLIKGMEFAKSLSSAGAGAVQKGLLKYSGADRIQTAMKNAPRNIGGGIKSTAGASARQSLGWGANKVSESKSFRDWAAKSAIGRTALKATQGVADAKFGGKKGYVGNQKDAIKSREDFSKKLGEKTLSELLNDQKKAKADKVLATQTIENNNVDKKNLEERRTAIETELKPFEDKALLLEQQIKEAEAEYKAKEASSNDRHFSDSALEKKISDLRQEKDAHATQLVAIKQPLEKEKTEIDEKLKANTEELKTALGKMDVGFEKDKYKDDKDNAKFNEWAEKTLKEGAKVREENKEFQGKSIEELQKLHDDNKKEASAGKVRQELYAKQLSSPRIFNLGIPSNASRKAAFNIRKELSKSKEDKSTDDVVKKMKEMLKEKDEKPKDEPKK
jgi:hypothetical protein